MKMTNFQKAIYIIVVVCLVMIMAKLYKNDVRELFKPKGRLSYKSSRPAYR
jgi:hypothetical protein